MNNPITKNDFFGKVQELNEDLKPKLVEMFKRMGCPKYAKLVDDFDFKLLPPGSEEIAYLRPDNGTIYINCDLDPDYVSGSGDLLILSVVVRHEILHSFLEHERRLINHLVSKFRDTFGTVLDDKDLVGVVKKYMYSTPLFNIAADLEFSNRGYTKRDKEILKQIRLGGRLLMDLLREKNPETKQECPVLVTEYLSNYESGMERMSMTELYDKLSSGLNQINDIDNLFDVGSFAQAGDDSSSDIGADGDGSSGGQQGSAGGGFVLHGHFDGRYFVTKEGKKFYGKVEK